MQISGGVFQPGQDARGHALRTDDKHMPAKPFVGRLETADCHRCVVAVRPHKPSILTRPGPHTLDGSVGPPAIYTFLARLYPALLLRRPRPEPAVLG
ncbi:hypothetical protein GCM10010304_06370 [Streptomyces roseoviolaceus]